MRVFVATHSLMQILQFYLPPTPPEILDLHLGCGGQFALGWQNQGMTDFSGASVRSDPEADTDVTRLL